MIECMSRRKPNSKRSLGVDRHTKPRLAFHLEPELHEAFRIYVDGLQPQSSDTAVLVLALERYLQSVGFWPPK